MRIGRGVGAAPHGEPPLDYIILLPGLFREERVNPNRKFNCVKSIDCYLYDLLSELDAYHYEPPFYYVYSTSFAIL